MTGEALILALNQAGWGATDSDVYVLLPSGQVVGIVGVQVVDGHALIEVI